MRKDVMMISAGLMMMAMASCNQTEYREITAMEKLLMQIIVRDERRNGHEQKEI